RHHLGRIERDPRGDGADGRSGGAQRLPRGAGDPPAHPAADADQFRRIESVAGEGRDGRDGTARGAVPAADVSAETRVAREDRQGAEGSGPAESGAGVSLESEIAHHVAAGAAADKPAVRATFATLRDALSSGEVRAAEPDASSPIGWRVNTWVKQGILLGFRFGDNADVSADHGRWPFYDKDTLPLKKPGLAAGVRIVPGGSSVRDGAYIAPGVICMPPMYINIGAYVGEQSLIDSHALVGSCAQVGARVHVSAGAQIGGVIEPVGALPVIIEDEALIGGNTGIYEGAIIRTRAVVAAGTVLT